jgi:ATP-dependent RNA helicase RhlE
MPANVDSDAASDVQLDAIPQDSLSMPVPFDGSANGTPDGGASDGGASAGATDKPKRRRRRHHKKAPSTSTTDKVGGTEGDSSDNGSDGNGGDNAPSTVDPAAQPTDNSPAPRRRRRKKRTRSASAASSPAAPAQTSPESLSPAPSSPAPSSPEASSEEPRPADDKPKRRRRKRKKKPANAPATDSRKANPNAHPFGPFALVITPTRELAQQIDRVVSVVCEYTNQRAVIVMGGAKFDRQIRSLEEGCDMLVATPGRLIDLMEHDHVDLSHVEVLVLDEADRMLDMGFWPSVRRIVAALPSTRQNLLFSATIPPSIQSTIDAMLHDPVRVEIARVGETAETVEEHLCPITQGQKTQLLQELIRRTAAIDAADVNDTVDANDTTDGNNTSNPPVDASAPADPTRVLVFCRTKQRVDDVSRTLKNAGFSVDVMHADRPQKARERALAKFRAGKCQVLVATDVMSRGIDVSGIDAVVNFDVPLDPEDYVHRIGRTGRAGATGQAYTFMAPDEVSPLREIEYFTSGLIPTWDLPGFAYDEGRIVPSVTRSTVKPKRTMFSGMRSRGRGMYGRHY